MSTREDRVISSLEKCVRELEERLLRVEGDLVRIYRILEERSEPRSSQGSADEASGAHRAKDWPPPWIGHPHWESDRYRWYRLFDFPSA